MAARLQAGFPDSMPARAGVRGLWWLSRRRIEEPIRSLVKQCKAIQEGRALRQLVLDEPTAEIEPLVTAFNELLSHLNRTMTRQHLFVADAAHELRTPLTAQTVVGQNVLGRRETSPELRDAISSMLEEANHMKRLIDSLLALTRASLTQTDEEKAHRTPLELCDLARRCVHSLQILAEEKQQCIDLEAQGPLWAQVELTMVRQALLNIIHNAIEHCPEKTAIRIETLRSGAAGLIVVSDNGPGITLEDQPRVFERFYRGAGASRRRGLGLGLAIARALLIS
ncbi:MAG: sensor histidine kinase, partial [Steroidobacteraceae bacterium]